MAPQKVEYTDIRISSVRTDLKEDLTRIAEYNGVDLSAFLKMKFRELVDSAPQKAKEKK